MKKTLVGVSVVVVMVLAIILTSCSGNYFDLVFVVDGQEYERVELSTTGDVSIPVDPQKDDLLFDGWYFDEGRWEKPFTVSSLMELPLKESVEVYAHFVEKSALYTVTFDCMNGSDNIVKEVYGNTLIKGMDEPKRDGYMFSGWYLYPDYVDLFDIETTKVVSNMTLYAKWTPKKNATLDYQEILTVTPNAKYETTFMDVDGNRYVIFLLGTRENVILNKIDAPTHYLVPGQTIGFDVGEVTEETLEESFERTIGTSVGMSAGFEIGVSAFVHAVFSMEFSVTVDESVSEGYSKAISASKSTTNTNDLALESCELGKYYAWAIVGTEDVYQYIKLNNKNEIAATGLYSNILTCETRVVSSDNSAFKYDNNFQLEAFDESDVRELFGNGSIGNPYKIDSVCALKNIVNCPNACYKLVNNLDMQGESVIVETFAGVLDGNNYTITNLTIDNKASYTGLVGINNGTIKNLTLKNAIISGKVDDIGINECYVGAFAGKNCGTINNCKLENSTVYGYAYRYNVNEKAFVGGIAGFNEGTVKSCIVKDSSVEGYSNIGRSDKSVTSDVGGIVGRSDGGRIDSCVVLNSKIHTQVRGGKTWTFTDFESYGRAGGIAGTLYGDAVVTACNESNNQITEKTNKAEPSGHNNKNKVGALVGYVSLGTVDSNNQYSSLPNSKG